MRKKSRRAIAPHTQVCARIEVGANQKSRHTKLLLPYSMIVIANCKVVIRVDHHWTSLRELRMNTRTPKLVTFYRERHVYGRMVSTIVAKHYCNHTLKRMVHSRDIEKQQAAIWGLGLIGKQAEYSFLGPWLRTDSLAVRREADDARSLILERIRCEWQRQYALEIEDSIAEANWNSARRMADLLVTRHGLHPESWLLRSLIRLYTSQLSGAIDDCRHVLSFDPECYRACVLLGQCYWLLDRQATAKECFLEAARIYPECRAAKETLHRYFHSAQQ